MVNSKMEKKKETNSSMQNTNNSNSFSAAQNAAIHSENTAKHCAFPITYWK